MVRVLGRYCGRRALRRRASPCAGMRAAVEGEYDARRPGRGARRSRTARWPPTSARWSTRSSARTCASCSTACIATPTAAYHEAPAAKYYHQAYRHGLLEHCLSVAQGVSALAATFPEIDRDVAVTGALLHDIGKVEAYSWSTGAIELTDAGKLLGEIPLGYYRVRREIERIDGFPADGRRRAAAHHPEPPRQARARQPGGAVHARGDARALHRQPGRQPGQLRPHREGARRRRALVGLRPRPRHGGLLRRARAGGERARGKLRVDEPSPGLGVRFPPSAAPSLTRRCCASTCCRPSSARSTRRRTGRTLRGQQDVARRAGDVGRHARRDGAAAPLPVVPRAPGGRAGEPRGRCATARC